LPTAQQDDSVITEDTLRILARYRRVSMSQHQSPTPAPPPLFDGGVAGSVQKNGGYYIPRFEQLSTNHLLLNKGNPTMAKSKKMLLLALLVLIGGVTLQLVSHWAVAEGSLLVSNADAKKKEKQLDLLERETKILKARKEAGLPLDSDINKQSWEKSSPKTALQQQVQVSGCNNFSSLDSFPKEGEAQTFKGAQSLSSGCVKIKLPESGSAVIKSGEYALYTANNKMCDVTDKVDNHTSCADFFNHYRGKEVFVRVVKGPFVFSM
jgi:hypothetical protein